MGLSDQFKMAANGSPNQGCRTGCVVSINRSDGGVPKQSVDQVLITEAGVAADRQRNLELHGGPDRAVLLYSLEVIGALAGEGHPIGVGTVGENLTVSGIDWTLMIPGTEVSVGPVRLRITKYATPCHKIKQSFLNEDFSRIRHDLHPGWSRVCCRVLEPGIVQVNSPVVVL